MGKRLHQCLVLTFNLYIVINTLWVEVSLLVYYNITKYLSMIATGTHPLADIHKIKLIKTLTNIRLFIFCSKSVKFSFILHYLDVHEAVLLDA